jgi:hypothetical protein
METQPRRYHPKYFVCLFFLLIIAFSIFFFDAKWIQKASLFVFDKEKVTITVVTNITRYFRMYANLQPNREIINQTVFVYIDTSCHKIEPNTPTLQNTLDSFDWSEYYQYEGKRWPTKLMEKYQRILIPYLESEVHIDLTIPTLSPLLQ